MTTMIDDAERLRLLKYEFIGWLELVIEIVADPEASAFIAAEQKIAELKEGLPNG